jgi:galactokinase
MTSLQEQVTAEFEKHFGQPPAHIVRAPGRVNLIGEHTDYNDGFVMPFAIEMAVYVAASPRDDDRITVNSTAFSESLDVSLADLGKEVPNGWTRYPFGVISLMLRAGHQPRGADLLIGSDIPSGAGLSSSAALEVGIAKALDSLFELKLSDIEIVKIGQRTENEFAGVNSGIMDQMASVLGRSGHALFLDCRSLEWQHVPLEGASFLVCDTRTKHTLAESEYNNRRSECEAAAVELGVATLREATLHEINGLSGGLAKRARHVVTENLRVEAAVDALRSGDLEAVGGLINESHASLRDDFEVSCRELDIMSAICRSRPEILGSRMIGGGFGGCALSIARADTDLAIATREIAAEYELKTGIEPAIFICKPEDGVSEIIGLTN